MNAEEALKILEKHQPLPDDKYISQELLVEYDEIRKYFITHPDARCIPLFLGSFGSGSGFGVYQLVEDVLNKYDNSLVVSYIRMYLNSLNYGVKYWNTEIASIYPDETLIDPLSINLNDPDTDIRCAAARALAFIKSDRCVGILSERLAIETDDFVYEHISEILEDLRNMGMK